MIESYPIAYGKYTPDKKEFEIFYDTHLHLTEEGTALRTEQLIKDLMRWKETQ